MDTPQSILRLQADHRVTARIPRPGRKMLMPGTESWIYLQPFESRIWKYIARAEEVRSEMAGRMIVQERFLGPVSIERDPISLPKSRLELLRA